MLTTIISAFLIGNVIAWFSGAAPIDFPEVPYNEQQQQQLSYLQEALHQQPNDVDLQLELGQLYSHHNQLKKAEKLLTKALKQAPKNPLVRAAYYSNDGKLAGAMFDPSMGIYKLTRLHSAMDEVNAAAEDAPDNMQVRLIRLMTFAFVGDISGYSDTVFEDEQWFQQQSSPSLPDRVKQLVYISLAHAYQTQDEQQASRYAQQAKALGPCPNTLLEACQALPQPTLAAES